VINQLIAGQQHNRTIHEGTLEEANLSSMLLDDNVAWFVDNLSNVIATAVPKM